MSSAVNLLISSEVNWTSCSLNTSTRGGGETSQAACNRKPDGDGERREREGKGNDWRDEDRESMRKEGKQNKTGWKRNRKRKKNHWSCNNRKENIDMHRRYIKSCRHAEQTGNCVKDRKHEWSSAVFWNLTHIIVVFKRSRNNVLIQSHQLSIKEVECCQYSN